MKNKSDNISVNNPSRPTCLSLVASMASMGVVNRPAELSADELTALQLFDDCLRASYADDYPSIEDFHRFAALCREAGDDDDAVVFPEHASSASANVDWPPVTSDADQQPIRTSTDAFSKEDLKFSMPWTFPPAGKDMFIRSQTIHILKVLVQFKLFVKNSPNGAYELFELGESELQQASFGFPFSDYQHGRNFGALEAQIRSPIYNKRLDIRITSRGIVTVNNITHRDEITLAVRQVVDTFRAVGAAMLSSAHDCGPLASVAKKRAERFITTEPRDVDIRNITAQTYLPGWVNTVKMQQACNAQLEPSIHDRPASCELKRSLLPCWYGKNVCVKVHSTGMVSFAGLRNFQALNLCAEKACDLARDFICEPSLAVCKNINERLKLAPLVRAIDAATSSLPVAHEAVDDVDDPADCRDDAVANYADKNDENSGSSLPPRLKIAARRSPQAFVNNLSGKSQNVDHHGVNAAAAHEFPQKSMVCRCEVCLLSTTQRTPKQRFGESPPIISSSQSMLAKPSTETGQCPNSSLQATPTDESHAVTRSQKHAAPRKSYIT